MSSQLADPEALKYTILISAIVLLPMCNTTTDSQAYVAKTPPSVYPSMVAWEVKVEVEASAAAAARRNRRRSRRRRRKRSRKRRSSSRSSRRSLLEIAPVLVS